MYGKFYHPLSEPRSSTILNQTYLLLTGKPLFDESYVASPVKVAVLRTCLAVKTADRATALEVLEGGWIKSGCACGWCD